MDYFLFYFMGIVCISLELIFSLFFLLWIGAALMMTGFTLWLSPLTISQTMVFFGGYLTFFLGVGRLYYNKKQAKIDETPTVPFHYLIGAEAIYYQEDGILEGGYILINDVRWRVKSSGQKMSHGTPVVIMAIQDNHVVVEPRI